MTWILSIPWARNDGCLDCDFFVDLGALTCVSYFVVCFILFVQR